MNSRKKRFWKLWQKRNEEMAMTNVEEANRIRNINRCDFLVNSIAISSVQNK